MYIQKNTQKQKRLKNVPRIFRKTLFLTYPYFPGTRNITIAEDFDSRAIKSVTRKRAILIRFLWYIADEIFGISEDVKKITFFFEKGMKEIRFQ